MELWGRGVRVLIPDLSAFHCGISQATEPLDLSVSILSIVTYRVAFLFLKGKKWMTLIPIIGKIFRNPVPLIWIPSLPDNNSKMLATTLLLRRACGTSLILTMVSSHRRDRVYHIVRYLLANSPNQSSWFIEPRRRRGRQISPDPKFTTIVS